MCSSFICKIERLTLMAQNLNVSGLKEKFTKGFVDALSGGVSLEPQWVSVYWWFC